MRIKLNVEVKYAIGRFVCLYKYKNKIPRKKNSSVNDSKKLRNPVMKLGVMAG